jgi:hypothetical protein
MCRRARLFPDVGEIKLVFSIPPHRPAPNIVSSWNVARRRTRARDHHRMPTR